MYGDNYVPFDFGKYIAKYEKLKKSSILLVYENSDNYSNSNISLGRNNLVLKYEKTLHQEIKYVDVGYSILNKNDLLNIEYIPSLNFGKDILIKLINEKKLYAESVKQRYYTVGTMQRLQQTRYFFSKRKEFIFIDRDGVLNEKQPKGQYVTNLDSFKWKKGALEGLKILKNNNFQVVLITNQAGIGRGLLSEEQLNKIHQKMCQDAKDNGGEIE